MNSENIDVSRCPTTGSKEEVTQSYAHKSVEADSTMQQPEQAKNINIEKTETATESSLPLSLLSTEVIMMQEVCLQSFTLDMCNNKVLSLLEDCFDLISGSSLSMKIQIMCEKITENLGFKSPLRKVKFFWQR